MKRQALLSLLLKAAPWVMFVCAVDERLSAHQHRIAVLERELRTTQCALLRHSGDQLHLAPHPSPN